MTLTHPHRQKQLQKLLQKLGLSENSPVQWQLLDLALTHPTISPAANYEQLEFVGDAVVRLAAAELLLETYPDCQVGEFAAIRSVLVSDRALAKIADSYGWDRYLLVANSAAADTAGLESRLADSLEAVLAALYLSTHTLELVRPWLDSHFKQLATEIRTDPARQNYKAALQEWTQAHYKALPVYRVKETTQVHDDAQRFTAEVLLEGRRLGQGKGRSIKAAQQAAAQEAFLSLHQASHPDFEP
ncbi:ribonuclease III [Microcoleus sp. FACHB-672]|uniref:ribonuclease III n=1 Tax=Microcoleus sp. FACHB-672 TaxID=2692825 RepID=UPI001685EE98|nr:ribonuclease III [Microcoleus sp. FACHB-672]MBD2039361.1 ribonuclease III [Microcoleus sp. FACHB-672]